VIGRLTRSLRFRGSRLITLVDEAAWRSRTRGRGLRTGSSGGVSTEERGGQFAHERIPRFFQHPLELEDRLYNYVHYPAASDVLCVHFSAFFGEWGDRREHRPQFAGYFHRLRMFWPLAQYQFQFLCDTFGAERNGTYYKGESGDYFVERAVDEIVESVRTKLDIDPSRVVTMGSSMGATGALRTALKHGYGGVVAVSPHIDLDLSAIHQDRRPHVAAMLGSEDVDDPRHYDVTREIRRLAEETQPLPRLVIQSMEDDVGVHEEQVVPLVEIWRRRGGSVRTDFRETGGHTSDYATPEFFAEAIEWVLDPR
jgi:pimeloyl-ACP methyl ester carboxylesterase